MSHLTLATFSEHVGSLFRLRLDGDGFVELDLLEAKDLSDVDPNREAELRAPFSLLFRGPTEPAFGQRMYRLEHAELGAVDLFLVPMGPDRKTNGGLLYEAVFN